jgi:hypothetical protein
MDILLDAAFGKDQPTVSEETLAEKHANLTGEILEGSSRGKRSISQRGRSIRNSSTPSKSAREITGSDKKGMVLPFTPLSLTFDDVKYSVDMPPVHMLLYFSLKFCIN